MSFCLANQGIPTCMTPVSFTSLTRAMRGTCEIMSKGILVISPNAVTDYKMPWPRKPTVGNVNGAHTIHWRWPDHHHPHLHLLRKNPPEIRQEYSRSDTSSRLQGSEEAAVGQMGLWNPGTAQEVSHLAGFVPGAWDGSQGIRRRCVLLERSESAAELPRRARTLAEAVFVCGARYSSGCGQGCAYEEVCWQSKRLARKRRWRRWFLGRDRIAGADDQWWVLLEFLWVDNHVVLRRRRRRGAFATVHGVPVNAC